MSPITRTASFLLIVLTMAACRIENLDDPIIIPLVNKEFSLEMWENLTPSGSTLEFHIATVDDEECENATILTGYQKSGSTMDFTVFEILEPENCIPGNAPATGAESILGAIEGEYDLQIELQDLVVNHGNLVVTPNYYRVEMDREDGIGWDHYELRRVPAGALWGYVSFVAPDEGQQATDFIQSIREASLPLSLADGYYGHFTISSSGSVIALPDLPAGTSAKTFLVEFWGDEAELSQTIANFQAQMTENMTLKICNYKGQVW